jgi:hypothetical protein
MLQLQLYQHQIFYFRNVGTLVSLSPFYIEFRRLDRIKVLDCMLLNF